MTRTCTRCRDANGVPTGTVAGGECFLCHGTGTYVRATVSAEEKAAGSRRMQAINILRSAGLNGRAAAARCELEQTAPERHERLIASVLSGRTAQVIEALGEYARANRIY